MFWFGLEVFEAFFLCFGFLKLYLIWILVAYENGGETGEEHGRACE